MVFARVPCSQHWYTSALSAGGLLSASPAHHSSFTHKQVITLSKGVCFTTPAAGEMRDSGFWGRSFRPSPENLGFFCWK